MNEAKQQLLSSEELVGAEHFLSELKRSCEHDLRKVIGAATAHLKKPSAITEAWLESEISVAEQTLEEIDELHREVVEIN